MTIKQARELNPGDEVFWKDPDQGLCSKAIVIDTIIVEDDGIVKLSDRNGGYLECWVHELF